MSRKARVTYRYPAVQRRSIAALSIGHLFADWTQGAVPALLPFLVAERGYSYASASALVMAASISSSVVQPLFGHWSDRRAVPALMPLGLFAGGIGISLVGIAPTPALTFLAVIASGLGVAAFHPEASRSVAHASGTSRATGMGLFAVGGNLGFALAPLLVTPALVFLGLPGTLVLAGPAFAVAAFMTIELPKIRALAAMTKSRTVTHQTTPAAWGPFVRLTALVIVRSLFYFGLSTFVALYFVEALNASAAGGNVALAVMLVGGAAGTLLGGLLADRFGRRCVLVGSLIPIAPLLATFLVSGRTVATGLVALIGALTIAPFSLAVVIGQEYLPARMGVASGITLGLAVGLGGIGTALLGPLADEQGVRTTLEILCVLPLAGLALALTLPREGPHQAGRRAIRNRGAPTGV